MKERQSLIEVGKVLGTHGVRGEIRLESWCDSPLVLSRINSFTIGRREYKAVLARVHKTLVLCRLEGVDTLETAIPLVGKTVFADRACLPVPEGRYLIRDLLGMSVVDNQTGAEIGELVEVISNPAHSVYRVEGQSEHLIPAIDVFIKDTDIGNGIIRVELIEGM